MKPIPSILEIYTRIAADLKNRLNISDSDLKKVIDGTAATLAGEIKLLYLFLSDVQSNQFPDTADTSENGGELNRHGQIQLNRQPRPATDGLYVASVSGFNGSIIRASLTFKSNDDSKNPGNLFIVDQEYILSGVDDEISIRSLDAGPDFLLAVGNKLTATEPLSGIDQQITVLSVSQIPAAAESIDLYRKNILNAIRLEPQGGAKTDYRIWASDAQGVERVFPYVKNGDAGVVQIFVEATKLDSIDTFGTPSQALLDAVEEVILFDPDPTLSVNERGRLPMTAMPEINPIQIKPVDINIYGLQIDNSEVRASITKNLDTFLFDVRPYIAGADLTRDKNDVLTTVKVQSVVSETIGNANSFLDFKLFIDGVEYNTFTFSGANIPYLRNINYL